MSEQEWKPAEKIPEIKKEFEDIHQEKQLENCEPITKLELEKLKSERAKPVETLDYTPDGSIRKSVHNQLNQERENRIQVIEERLGQYKNKSRDEFNKYSDDYLITRDDRNR